MWEPQLLVCSGVVPFCLAYSDLISGGLCGPSADHTCRENTWGCATRVALGRAALCQACSNGRGRRQMGLGACQEEGALGTSSHRHFPVCPETGPGGSSSPTQEQSLISLLVSRLGTTERSLGALLPVRGMEHLGLLRVPNLLGQGQTGKVLST